MTSSSPTRLMRSLEVQPVRFLDLGQQYRSIKEEVDAAVIATLESCTYVLGPQVEAFEEAFAAQHEVAHGVAMHSGTAALHLALLALGVGPGDEVIVPAMTFTATAAAVSYCGATPVFADVDPRSHTLDPASFEARITSRTKAAIPVHLYGQSADMDPIMSVAGRHGVAVIEDAAQAHLARYGDRPVGGFGRISCFSFYPGKNLGAYGEGGLAATDDSELAHKMRLLRDWGQARKYDHQMLAYNYRMDSIQGAVLNVKLRHLEGWTEARRSRAALYRTLLEGSGLDFAEEMPGRRHVYHIFSIFHPERDRLRQELADQGIETSLHYPVPLHLQKPYAHLGYREGEFPASERVGREQLSLPLYPELPESHIERVAAAVRQFAGSR